MNADLAGIYFLLAALFLMVGALGASCVRNRQLINRLDKACAEAFRRIEGAHDLAEKPG